MDLPDSFRIIVSESTHPPLLKHVTPLPSRPNAAGNMECTRARARRSAAASPERVMRGSSSGHLTPKICIPRRKLRRGANAPSSAPERNPQKSSGGVPSPNPSVSLFARIAHAALLTASVFRSSASSSAALTTLAFFASTAPEWNALPSGTHASVQAAAATPALAMDARASSWVPLRRCASAAFSWHRTRRAKAPAAATASCG